MLLKATMYMHAFDKKLPILGFLLILGCHASTPSRNWKVYEFFASRAGSGVKMYRESKNWHENPWK
jgi:hypothetical protein